MQNDYSKNEQNIEKAIQEIENGKDDGEETGQDSKPSFTEKLIALVREGNAILFHDQFGEAYIASHGDGTEILQLQAKSKNFRRWLSYQAHKELKRPTNSNVVSEAINTLEGYAIHEGQLYDLNVRVASYEGAIWYDLGSSAVKITAEGWVIVSDPPILFRRFNSQKNQIEPKHGGNLNLLDSLLPRSMTEGQKLLYKTSLVTGLIPDIPQTIDIFFGEHGSAKSTIVKMKKDLIDPSVIDEFTPPDNIRELVQFLSHHWYLPLGNLTRLDGWMSDCICRASTGGGFSKRELYTNDDDVIYKYIRIVSLNGINLIAEKPDLLDRALLIGNLVRIPENERIGDAEFWTQFREAKPLILGAMFDALSGSMREIDSIELSRLPRMADFTRWGCAVAKTTGGIYLHDTFLNAYHQNIATQHDQAIESSPIGTVIIIFMDGKELWEGTPSSLLDELNPLAASAKLDRDKRFPKNANWVWRRIQDVKVNLQEKGIFSERHKDGQRLIHLWKNKDEENAVPAVHDVMLGSGSPNIEDSIWDSNETAWDEAPMAPTLDL